MKKPVKSSTSLSHPARAVQLEEVSPQFTEAESLDAARFVVAKMILDQNEDMIRQSLAVANLAASIISEVK